jgi:hypothetical protein
MVDCSLIVSEEEEVVSVSCQGASGDDWLQKKPKGH